MALLSKWSLHKFLSKALVLLVLITVIVCLYLEFESNKLLLINENNNFDSDINRGAHLRHSDMNKFRSLRSKEVGKSERRGKKIFLAFFFWEQLTMATNNLLHLTALAAYGRRQVVVPFVKDSQFRGVETAEGYETLERYFNVSALNHTLRSHGHGTLLSWERFQDACKGKLDVLVYFEYTDLKNSTTYSLATPYVPCKKRRENVFHGIKIGRRICVNVFALDSVERFEDEVVKKLPCVGIFEWRGSSETNPDRTNFNLASVVGKVMSFRDTSGFFSSKLLHIAKTFIAQNLDPEFISVHIRTEQILKAGKNISAVKKCLSNLRTRIQTIRQANTVPMHVFIATDFTDFGSSSKIGRPARKNSKSLMDILLPLNPIVFQPAHVGYNLTDRGAVAIVEMNILTSGTHLVVVGGGSFQYWVVTQFLNKNNNDKTKVERLAC